MSVLSPSSVPEQRARAGAESLLVHCGGESDAAERRVEVRPDRRRANAAMAQASPDFMSSAPSPWRRPVALGRSEGVGSPSRGGGHGVEMSGQGDEALAGSDLHGAVDVGPARSHLLPDGLDSQGPDLVADPIGQLPLVGGDRIDADHGVGQVERRASGSGSITPGGWRERHREGCARIERPQPRGRDGEEAGSAVVWRDPLQVPSRSPEPHAATASRTEPEERDAMHAMLLGGTVVIAAVFAYLIFVQTGALLRRDR